MQRCKMFNITYVSILVRELHLHSQPVLKKLVCLYHLHVFQTSWIFLELLLWDILISTSIDCSFHLFSNKTLCYVLRDYYIKVIIQYIMFSAEQNELLNILHPYSYSLSGSIYVFGKDQKYYLLVSGIGRAYVMVGGICA